MKVLNQEAIRRMINGGASSVVAVSGGGGGGGGLSPAWVEENYVSKAFFNQLFTIHGTKTVTDEETGTTTVEEVEITPNQLIDDEYDVTDVEVKFGLWTQQFLSALGKNSSGGGGGGDTLTEPLASINNAGLGTPTAAGQAIVWNGSRWTFGTSGGGSVTSVGLSVPTGFTVSGSPVTSSGTIQLSFASGYSLPTTAKQNNWDAAYGWGNHANAGYLTSSDIQDMATKTWVTNTALSGYATRNWVTGTALNGYAKLTDNVASATKLQTARMLWGNNFNGTQSIGTPESWASLNWVTNIVMKGNLDWRYNGAGSMTSRIFEYESGGLSINACAFIFNSNKSANVSTFPGGKLDETTDWGGYSFRNVFTNNSLFENTLFLRQGLYMKNGFPIFMKNNAGANVSALVMESDNLVLGSGAYTNAGISTYIRGNTVNFQTANGANAATQVGHFDNSGNFYIDVAGKLLLMNDGTTTRSMLGINIPATHFHVCYGAVGADWQTRIYGGATTGIKFFCGSTEVASVYRNVDSNQNTYQGIRIGNALLSWDSTNNALKVQRYDGAAVNFYSLGGVSALGFTAPQSSLDAFRIDYLTSTNISTQTVDVATQMNLGSANCNIKVNSSSLTINAPAGLTLVTNSGYGLRASRFYLDATRYIYLDGTTLKYYNGSQSKTIVLS